MAATCCKIKANTAELQWARRRHAPVQYAKYAKQFNCTTFKRAGSHKMLTRRFWEIVFLASLIMHVQTFRSIARKNLKLNTITWRLIIWQFGNLDPPRKKTFSQISTGNAGVWGCVYVCAKFKPNRTQNGENDQTCLRGRMGWPTGLQTHFLKTKSTSLGQHKCLCRF